MYYSDIYKVNMHLLMPQTSVMSRCFGSFNIIFLPPGDPTGLFWGVFPLLGQSRLEALSAALMVLWMPFLFLTSVSRLFYGKHNCVSLSGLGHCVCDQKVASWHPVAGRMISLLDPCVMPLIPNGSTDRLASLSQLLVALNKSICSINEGKCSRHL